MSACQGVAWLIGRVPRELAEEHGTVWKSEAMTFDITVEVSLREGIADPQGATIERSLPALGFDGVSGVRVGKSIHFSIDATDEEAARREVEDLCARFLTNPVIEDAHIDVRVGQAA
jgi:phosphoribosylformylglycinamidine synthase PurS subunit